MNVAYVVFSLLAVCKSNYIWAQSLSVKSIREIHQDDKEYVTPKLDYNDNLCAVLIISLPTSATLQFKCNMIGEVERDGCNYIINVPAMTKRMTIFHEDTIPIVLEFSDYGLKIQDGVNYNINIDLPYPHVKQAMESYGLGAQYLIFKSDADIARVEVNGEYWPIERGVSKKMVPLGRYVYKVFSDNGRTAEGVVEVTSTKFSKTVNVKF